MELDSFREVDRRKSNQFLYWNTILSSRLLMVAITCGDTQHDLQVNNITTDTTLIAIFGEWFQFSISGSAKQLKLGAET